MTASAVHRCCTWKAVSACLAGPCAGLLAVVLFVIPGLMPTRWLYGMAAYVCLPPALVCAVGSLALVLTGVSDLFLSVEVHPFGLVWRRFKKSTALTWKEIGTVWNRSNHGHHGGKTHRCCFGYDLVLQDGRRFRFGPFLCGAEELGRAIDSETIRLLLPGTLNAYNAGATLEFGALQVSVRGWRRAGFFAHWDDVRHVYIDRDGWFTIEIEGQPLPRWIVLAPNKIANAHLLLALLREIGKLQLAPNSF